MAEPEVADLGDRALLRVFLLAFFLEYQNIIDLNVRVDDASLMQVVNALEDVMRPDVHLVVLDWLVLAEYTAA